MHLYLETQSGGVTVDITQVLYFALHGKNITFVFKDSNHTDKTFPYGSEQSALNEYHDFTVLVASVNQAKIQQCLR